MDSGHQKTIDIREDTRYSGTLRFWTGLILATFAAAVAWADLRDADRSANRSIMNQEARISTLEATQNKIQRDVELTKNNVEWIRGQFEGGYKTKLLTSDKNTQ
jgi:hypothetical protein